jgi:membrane protein DedA with SNARE-associated domain
MSLGAWTRVLLAHGAWGVGLGMFLESLFVPLPSELILPFAGYLVASGRLSLSAALAVALLGGTLGSLGGYWIGRGGGRPILLRWGRVVGVGHRELDSAERWFALRGERAVFWGRLIPGVRTYISIPAGVGAMPVWRFLGYSTLGSLPWNAAFVVAGAWLGARWASVDHLFHRIDVWLFALLVLALVAFVWHGRKKHEKS